MAAGISRFGAGIFKENGRAVVHYDPEHQQRFVDIAECGARYLGGRHGETVKI